MTNLLNMVDRVIWKIFCLNLKESLKWAPWPRLSSLGELYYWDGIDYGDGVDGALREVWVARRALLWNLSEKDALEPGYAPSIVSILRRDRHILPLLLYGEWAQEMTRRFVDCLTWAGKADIFFTGESHCVWGWNIRRRRHNERSCIGSSFRSIDLNSWKRHEALSIFIFDLGRYSNSSQVM